MKTFVKENRCFFWGGGIVESVSSVLNKTGISNKYITFFRKCQFLTYCFGGNAINVIGIINVHRAILHGKRETATNPRIFSETLIFRFFFQGGGGGVTKTSIFVEMLEYSRFFGKLL